MTPTPEQPEGPPFAASAIPTDPAEQEEWKERYTEELLDHFPGGINAPWRES